MSRKLTLLPLSLILALAVTARADLPDYLKKPEPKFAWKLETKAENFLGTWLKARNPATDAIIVGSKWGYTYVGSWRLDAAVHEVKDLSGDTLVKQFQSIEVRADADQQLLALKRKMGVLPGGPPGESKQLGKGAAEAQLVDDDDGEPAR